MSVILYMVIVSGTYKATFTKYILVIYLKVSIYHYVTMIIYFDCVLFRPFFYRWQLLIAIYKNASQYLAAKAELPLLKKKRWIIKY